MQDTEQVRGQLIQEIERRERQLKDLRGTLAQLDAAIKAANEAQAAARSMQERTLAALKHSAKEPEKPVSHAEPPTESVRTSSGGRPAVSLAEVISSSSGNRAAVKVEELQEVAPADEEEHTHEPAAVPPPPGYAAGWSTPGKYARIKVWKAVQNLITENRAPMQIEDIVRELQEGGAALGSDPMRTVSTAIGYMNDKIFHVSKSGGRTIVSVLRPSN